MSIYIKLIPSPIIKEVSYQVFRFWSNEQLGWFEFKKSLNQFIFVGIMETLEGKTIELTQSDLYDIYHKVQLLNGCIEEK